MTSLAFPALIKSARADGVRAVYGIGEFGYRSYFSASLPDRLYTGLDEAQRPQSIISEPAIDVSAVARPAEILARAESPDGTGWPTLTRQSIARLETLWLLVEDRQRLLDAQAIDALPHQTALVEHVLSNVGLQRVLIADEVGLGKTIEVGLIIQRLQRSIPGFKALYLTEARLVENVVEELERIGMMPRPRQWTADSPEARLRPGDTDPLVVASIHKAVANADSFAEAGPWNAIIVDEAHHLTDYSQDGGDPQERMRLVRQLIRERLLPDGRVLLLSGTPHQGHLERFKNLLKLLSPRDDLNDASGRVIYRIKDDIVGWDGEPLFPLRDVRPHRVVRVSAEYHRWIEDVHRLLAPGYGASRASAWRQAQALQWCASSPEAGLAYLARLALRSGFDPTRSRVLRSTLEALRPYRDGRSDEGIESVRARMLARARDIEDESEDVFSGGESLLMHVLEAGTALVTSDAFNQKLKSLAELLEEAPSEKFVIFAQPIETVYVLHRRLEEAYGRGSVSLIVGGQKDRKEQIHRFVNLPTTRFLVSSRSGGEGINLQVARRLVHFDVPWNPMELEQRVGRVHRYGGVRTVVVDTLVLEGSRETRVLNRARAKLAAIVRDLDRTRFELLYSRTMALIPIEELTELMAGEQFAPLDSSEEERLDALIQRGLQLLHASENEFRQRSAALRSVERGEVTYDDLESWLIRHAEARVIEGSRRLALSEDASGRIQTSTATRVLRLRDGRWIQVTPEAGVAVEDADGRLLNVQRVGLNDSLVASRIQAVVAEEEATIGAGAVLLSRSAWDQWIRQTALPDAFRAGGVLLVYLTRKIDQSATPPERSCSINGWLTSDGGESECELNAGAFASLLRLLRDPRPKQKPTALPSGHKVLERDLEHLSTLRLSIPGQPVSAVFPLAALQIEVD